MRILLLMLMGIVALVSAQPGRAEDSTLVGLWASSNVVLEIADGSIKAMELKSGQIGKEVGALTWSDIGNGPEFNDNGRKCKLKPGPEFLAMQCGKDDPAMFVRVPPKDSIAPDELTLIGVYSDGAEKLRLMADNLYAYTREYGETYLNEWEVIDKTVSSDAISGKLKGFGIGGTASYLLNSQFLSIGEQTYVKVSDKPSDINEDIIGRWEGELYRADRGPAYVQFNRDGNIFYEGWRFRATGSWAIVEGNRLEITNPTNGSVHKCDLFLVDNLLVLGPPLCLFEGTYKGPQVYLKRKTS